MLRSEAIGLLNELATVYSSLLANTTQISLHLSCGNTKLAIKSGLDSEQRALLTGFLTAKGLKVIELKSDSGIMLMII
jgi:hypothetical protein